MAGTIQPLIWTLLTALLWTGVALCYSLAAKRNLAMLPFVAVLATVGALLSAVCVVDWRAPVTLTAAIPLVAVIAVSGASGQVGMLCGGLAMRADPERSAVTWTVQQMAMVIPFLWAVLFWKEEFVWWRMASLPCLAISMTLLAPPGRHAARGDAPPRAWCRWVMAAFLGLGLNQVLAQEPSLRGWPDHANLRVPVSLAAGSVLLWIVSLWRRQCPGRLHLRYGVLAGLVVAAGNVTLFRALDVAAREDCAGIVFPIAIGGSILLFAAVQCSTRQMRITTPRLAGFAFGILAILLLG